mmetsp:Transcript_4589/g.7789  ORF Transcript_4589/g.7789 Transcript_4589/m.7789 type:complete len:127 (-) Transcript_4589:191-571(-)
MEAMMKDSQQIESQSIKIRAKMAALIEQCKQEDTNSVLHTPTKSQLNKSFTEELIALNQSKGLVSELNTEAKPLDDSMQDSSDKEGSCSFKPLDFKRVNGDEINSPPQAFSACVKKEGSENGLTPI